MSQSAVKPRAPRVRRSPPGDHIRKDQRNVFATMAVFAGIGSWVPLVIVLAFPLTFVCATLALVTALRSDARKGLSAAWVGVVLATAALFVHLLIVAIGFFAGWAVGEIPALFMSGS